MIFKTFNNDIDKISAKWGIFGRSFDDIGSAIVGRIKEVNRNFQATDDLLSSIKNSKGVFERLYPTKESIKPQLIDVAPKIDVNNVKSVTDEIIKMTSAVKSGKISWQQLYNTLPPTKKHLAQIGQELEGQIVTNEKVIATNEKLRTSALAHNEALKQQTLGAKAAALGMKALSLAANVGLGLLISWGLPKLIELVDNSITTFDELNEQIEENRQEYEDATQEIENLNSELETTKDRIDELNHLDKLSVTEQEELNNLKKYNAELERSVALEKLRQQNALKEQVDDTVEKYTKSKYTKDSLSQLNQAREYERQIHEYQSTLDRWEKEFGEEAKKMNVDLDDYLWNYYHLDWATYENELKHYQSLLKGLKSSNPSDEVLNEIEALEKGIQTLEDYGLEDLSKSDYEAYEKMVKDLNDMYKTFFDDITYTKIQIDPVFSSMESLEGVKDKLIEYFSNGGNFVGLREAFGDTILNDLEQACKDLNINYYDLLDFLYGDATQNYSSSNIADNILKEMFGEYAIEEYGSSLIGSFKQSLVSEINNMDVSTISLLLDFIDSDGKKYSNVKDFLDAFYNSLDVPSSDSDNETILSLNEEERKALDKYQSRLELITKLRDEWGDASASDKMSFMSDIAELFPEYDLSDLESGKQTIEEILSDLGISALNVVESKINNYSNKLANMFSEAFGEVDITSFVEQVEKYQNLLNEVQSGKVYSSEQVKEIIRDNADLADAIKIVEGGYQLEEDAIISLLNTSITAYNEMVSSQRYTTKEILKEKQKLIEIYGIEAEILDEIVKHQTSGNSLDLLSDDDLKFNYALTNEQIQVVNEYCDLIERIKLRYNQLFETIENGTDSVNASLKQMCSDYEAEYARIEDIIAKIEADIDLNGGVGTAKQYEDLIALNKELAKLKAEQYKKEETELERIGNELGTNSDEYREQLTVLYDIRRDIESCEKSIKNWRLDILNTQLKVVEKTIENIKKDIENTENKLGEQDRFISGAIGILEQEISIQEELRQSIQDQIDALEKENDERQRALDLEKAQYEFERAKSQRNVKLYTGEDKGYIYTENREDVRDKQENLSQLEHENKIYSLQKQVDHYDKVIDNLNTIKDEWSNIASKAQQLLDIEYVINKYGREICDTILEGSYNIDTLLSSYKTLLNTQEGLENSLSMWEKLKEDSAEIVEQYEQGSISYNECIEQITGIVTGFYADMDKAGKLNEQHMSQMVTKLLEEFSLIDNAEQVKIATDNINALEAETKSSTDTMGREIENVADTATKEASTSSKRVTGVIESETSKQAELMHELSDEISESFQTMCDNAVNSATVAFENLESTLISMASSIQEQISSIVESANSSISELQGLASEASALSDKIANATNVSSPIGASVGVSTAIAQAVEMTPKYAEGGVIKKDDKSPLDFLAKMANEDKTVFVKDGEYILTRANQTELMDRFKGMSNLVNPVVPNYIVPKYDFTTVNRTPQVSIGDVNVVCSGVTSQEVAKQIGDTLHREFGNMTLDALQIMHKR